MAAKLNILICTSIFPNREELTRGTYILSQAKALARCSHIRVIAPVPYFPNWLPQTSYGMFARIPLREQIDGLDVQHPRVVVIPKVGHLLNGIGYYLALSRTARKLREHFTPDVLLSYWVYPDGYASTWLGRNCQIPVIVGGLGCDVNNVGPRGPHRRMVVKTLERADRLMAVSAAMKERMVAFGIDPGKIAVIPNGLNSSFLPLNREEARRQAGLRIEGGNRKTILFCGRLSPEKGVDVLLDATKILDGRGISYHLLIVGDGPLKKILELQVGRLGLKGRVEFTGEVPPERIPLLMNSSDVLCLPSIREGWPNVVMEALGCGVPVVASRVGGIPEILRNPESGIMVPAGDPAALAEALKQALGHIWDPCRVRETVAGRTWDNVAEEILHEIRRVVSP